MKKKKDEKVEKRGKEKEKIAAASATVAVDRNITSHFFNLISTMIITMTIMTVTAKAAVILSIMTTIATIFRQQ